MSMEQNARAEAQHALKRAARAAKQGQSAEAERWSKTAERMSIAAERLASAPPSHAMDENEEEIRAELRARIRKLYEAEQEVLAWEFDREVYEQEVFISVRDRTPPPPPLRPCPGGPDYLERIARGEY